MPDSQGKGSDEVETDVTVVERVGSSPSCWPHMVLSDWRIVGT